MKLDVVRTYNKAASFHIELCLQNLVCHIHLCKVENKTLYKDNNAVINKVGFLKNLMWNDGNFFRKIALLQSKMLLSNQQSIVYFTCRCF
jgi:hypothetical protein